MGQSLRKLTPIYLYWLKFFLTQSHASNRDNETALALDDSSNFIYTSGKYAG